MFFRKYIIKILTNFSYEFVLGKAKYLCELAITRVYGICGLEAWSGSPEVTSKKK